MNRMWHDGVPIDRPPPIATIRKCGHLKKLKTMKRKYFVVWSSSTTQHAHLDYFDSEKKFRLNSTKPKRTIDLYTCFSINRKCDTKQKNAFVVYTKDDSLAIVADSEDDLERWLEILQELHEEGFDIHAAPRPVYEHVWETNIQNKGLAAVKNMSGNYRVCLSDNSVSLVRVGDDVPEAYFQLAGIRRCGHSSSQFFMEVGRCTSTGEGEVWMFVDDALAAQSMHEVILNAMKCHGSAPLRTDSRSSRILSHQESSRSRAGSLGHSVSPRRPRTVKIHDSPRPQTMYNTPISDRVFPSPSLSQRELSVTIVHNRSNSSDSHDSSAPSDPVAATAGPVRTAQELVTESPSVGGASGGDQDYFNMMPPPHSSRSSRSSSIASRTSSRGSRDRLDSRGSGKEEPSRFAGYMDMTPTDYTPMTPGKSPSADVPDGYIDMSPSQACATANSSLESSGYLSMEPTIRQQPPPLFSSPLAHRPAEEGYFDMVVNPDLLPTVKEITSPGYITMRAKGYNPASCDFTELKPDRVVSYVSDDPISGEIPKRTYSVGSRPLNKHMTRYHSNAETTPAHTLEGNKSTSAPHLKIKAPFITSGASPTTLSSSYKSDDSDSFMEIEFYRSRTASDSQGTRPRTVSESLVSRPRTSSFTQANKSRYAHRPRSSSHGQSSHVLLNKPMYHHSVRTTSSELLKQVSQESLGKSSRESLLSSNESLRKYAIEERARQTALSGGEYFDMKPIGPASLAPKQSAKFGYKPNCAEIPTPKSGESSPDAGSKGDVGYSPVGGRAKDAYMDYDPAENVPQSADRACHSYVNLDYEVPLIPASAEPPKNIKPEKKQNTICDSSTSFTPLVHSSSEILICGLDGDLDVPTTPPAQPLVNPSSHLYVNVSPETVRATTIENESSSDPYVAYDPIDVDHASNSSSSKGASSLDSVQRNNSGRSENDYLCMAPVHSTHAGFDDATGQIDAKNLKMIKAANHATSNVHHSDADLWSNKYKYGDHKKDQIAEKTGYGNGEGNHSMKIQPQPPLSFRDNGIFSIKKCPLRKISEAVEPPLDVIQKPPDETVKPLQTAHDYVFYSDNFAGERDCFAGSSQRVRLQKCLSNVTECENELNTSDELTDAENFTENSAVRTESTNDSRVSDICVNGDNVVTVDFNASLSAPSDDSSDRSITISSSNIRIRKLSSECKPLPLSDDYANLSMKDVLPDGNIDYANVQTQSPSLLRQTKMPVDEITFKRCVISEPRRTNSDEYTSLKVPGKSEAANKSTFALSSELTAEDEGYKCDRVAALIANDLICDKVSSLIGHDVGEADDKTDDSVASYGEANKSPQAASGTNLSKTSPRTSVSLLPASLSPPINGGVSSKNGGASSVSNYVDMCLDESVFHDAENVPNIDSSEGSASSAASVEANKEPQKSLNYISVDVLSETLGARGRAKSRHTSGGDVNTPCQYATIDFKRSEQNVARQNKM